jgi:hypothetical protein
MLTPLTDLIRYTALADGARFQLRDVALSADMTTPTHLVIDKGATLAPEPVVLPFLSAGTPDADAREVTVDTTASGIASAPPITPGGIPGVVADVGAALAGETPKPEPGDALIRECLGVHQITGLSVQGPEGPVGTVIDLLLDWEARRITHVVVDNGQVLAGRQLVVPIGYFGAPDIDAGEVRCSLTAEQLADAPQIEAHDAVTRHWMDTVRTYYRFPL